MSYIGKSKLINPVINYAHPNHSGEVTSNSDGAQTIADGAVVQARLGDQAVNEAKLQVSNNPVNGYALVAQSGNTGGMTWTAFPSGGLDSAVEVTNAGSQNSFTAPSISGDRFYSVAIGHASTISSGGYNFVFGRECKITSGEGSLAIGYKANSATNWGTCLTNNSTGTQYGTYGGNQNFCFGAYAKSGAAWSIAMGNQCTASHTGSVVIGKGISSGADYEVNLGNSAGYVKISDVWKLPNTAGSSGQQLQTDGSNASWASASSDYRVKKNINISELGLDFIEDLTPKTFEFKSYKELDKKDPDLAHYKPDVQTETEDSLPTSLRTRKGVQHGFIAQEVKESLDKLGVSNFQGWKEDRWGVQEIHDQAFIIPLIKAVQELSQKVKDLEGKLNGS